MAAALPPSQRLPDYAAEYMKFAWKTTPAKKQVL